ncbi:MAG: DoxX family protein [Anaerolineales bacterium]
MLEETFAPYSDLGLLILRTGMAIVLLVHGWLKVNPNGPVKGPAGLAKGLNQMGFPIPGLLAWIVVLLETLGAGMLVLGLGTRILAVMVSIEMLVIILYVKRRVMKTGFMAQQATGWELDFTVLVGALALLFTGAGRIALDRLVGL